MLTNKLKELLVEFVKYVVLKLQTLKFLSDGNNDKLY